MDSKELLQEFPTKRPKPYDGMSVTANVWEEAHAYHRRQLQMHALFSHGAGIVTGLEVVASDPPDSTVYILPGIAVDALGRTVVLTEPVGYDFGSDSQGLLYLLLSAGQVERAATGDGGLQAGEPLYVYTEFVVEAQPVLPDGPVLELARVRRDDREAPLIDTADPAHCAANEIDLRYRREVGAMPARTVTVGVGYIGDGVDRRHGRGMDLLARAATRSGTTEVVVDDGIVLGPDLETYDLVYLVGRESFELGVEEMNALYAYHQAGGTLLLESCRQATAGSDPAADGSFLELLNSLGLQLGALDRDHILLADPFAFAAPPSGFETEGEGQVLVGDGVISSTRDYGCLWQGERRGRLASREEIRSAMEWGQNVLAFAASTD